MTPAMKPYPEPTTRGKPWVAAELKRRASSKDILRMTPQTNRNRGTAE